MLEIQTTTTENVQLPLGAFKLNGYIRRTCYETGARAHDELVKYKVKQR
jgi:hypothetical protein